MKFVFSGSGSLTTLVTTIVLIDGGVLLAGAVTVLMLSEVWMRVKISVTEAADVVASEPPSTATTEYATRLRTGGCLGYAWGFSGKAWETSFKEQSANTNRRDLRHMIEGNAMRGYWKSLKGTERGEALENRDTFATERERERGSKRDCAVCKTQG